MTVAKPKLAIIAPDSLPIPPLQGGSIQTIIYDLARQMQDLEITIFSKKTKTLPSETIDDHGIKYIYINNYSFQNIDLKKGSDFFLRWSFYLYKICRQLKKIEPDIVHLHNRPHWVPIIRRFLGERVKIILTDHNQKIAEDKYVLKKIDQIEAAVDLFVYPSRKIAELDLLSVCEKARAKTLIIYNAIDVEKFRSFKGAKEQVQLRQKYAIEHGKLLLFVGRLVAEKAVDKLLEAFPLVLKEEPSAKLLLIGSSFFSGAKETPFIKKLKRIAEPFKDNIIFTGFIDNNELPQIYSLADLFVSPVNWDDPSPKTIYEAAACGCAILATKRGGIPEIVKADESAVLLDSPYEIDELAAAILALLREPETGEALGQNARTRMVENFSVEKIAGEWNKLYLELAQSPLPKT